MTWLLIGALVGALAGVTGLAIVIAAMAKSNRTDLRELADAERLLGKQRRELDAAQRAIEELEHALSEKQSELVRERSARLVEPPRPSGDPVADLHTAVRRLPTLPGVPTKTTTPDDNR